MWRYLVVLLMLLFVACEPTETEEVVPVSETPYLVYVFIGNDGEDKVLVPHGKALAVNDVESISLQYSISPFSDETPDGFIRIEALNILIDGSEEYADLVQVTIVDQVGLKLLPILNEEIIITIKVELLEPIDEQEAIDNGLDLSLVNVEDSVTAYEAIIGKSISFDISFVIVNQE